MFRFEWTQADLAHELGFHRSNISKVISGKQALPQERRIIAERLLTEAQQ